MHDYIYECSIAIIILNIIIADAALDVSDNNVPIQTPCFDFKWLISLLR